MLYVTTRNKSDSFPAQRVLREKRGLDGGLYLPFQRAVFSPDEVDSLLDKPFGEMAAEILNRLFGARLSSWDVDFAIGRFPVRVEQLHHRILVCEPWHNPDWRYGRLFENLARLLSAEACVEGSWVKIAIQMLVLFGTFGELKRSGIECADVSVVSGDLSSAMSVWYARQWGLPVRNIICCCNENHGLWDLVCHGQLRTDTISVPTPIPEADVAVPVNLERVIYECGGTEEVRRYLDACRRGIPYCPNDAVVGTLRKGMYVSVVSSNRINSTIAGLYRTGGYVMSPHTALAYAGMLDYRAKKGETGYTVVLSEKSPMEASHAIAEALDMPESGIRNLL